MSFAEKHCEVAIRVLERIADGASLDETLAITLNALIDREERPIRAALVRFAPGANAQNRCLASTLGGTDPSVQSEDPAVTRLLERLTEHGLDHLSMDEPTPLQEPHPDAAGEALRARLADLDLDAAWQVLVTDPQNAPMGTLACFWAGRPILSPAERAHILRTARLAGALVAQYGADGTLHQRHNLQHILERSVSGFAFQCERHPDGSTTVPYVSRHLHALYGIHPAELRESEAKLQNVVHPADWRSFATALRRSAEGLRRWEWEGRILPPRTNEVRWVQIAGRPVQRPEGVVRWDAFLMDVTERKRAEEALRRSEARYHTLFEGAGDAIFIMRDEVYLECNSEALRIYGCDEPGDLIGHSPWEFSPEVQPDGQSSREKAKAVVQRARSGEPQHFHWRHLKKDGTPFDAEVTLTLIRLEHQSLIQAIVRDVTTRRAAQRALWQSERKYRLLAEHATDLISRQAPDGTIRYASPAARDLLGYEPEELVGRNAAALCHPEDTSVFEAHLGTLIAGAARDSITYRIRRKDGSYVWFETTNKTICDERGEVTEVIAISRDVTERVQRQELLERQAVRLGIVKEISAAILHSRTPVQITEAVLERLASLVPFEHASVTEYDYESGTVSFLAQLPDDDTPHASNQPIPFEETNAVRVAETHRAVYISDLDAVQDRSDAQDALHEWGIRSYVLVPAVIEGNVVGSLNVERSTPRAFSEDDISVLKEVASLLAVALQQARYREELIAAKEEAEEMSQLKSAFLANMSHEIRTPLTSIIGFAELLVDMVDGEPERLLQMIQTSGHRLRETLTAVLELAELESGSKRLALEAFDVRQAIKDLVLVFDRKVREKGLLLHVEAPRQPVRALADRTALKRALTNLVTNAIKFTDEGSITIRLTQDEEGVEIEVRDTGIGVAPEFVAQLFDTFTQESEGMRRDYEGAGLGLSIAKQLVELMHGSIDAQSVKGEGSVFTVRLPAPTDEVPDDAS